MPQINNYFPTKLFKTFTYSVTKKPKVFEKQKNIASLKFFVKPLDQINWLYIK